MWQPATLRSGHCFGGNSAGSPCSPRSPPKSRPNCAYADAAETISTAINSRRTIRDCLGVISTHPLWATPSLADDYRLAEYPIGNGLPCPSRPAEYGGTPGCARYPERNQSLPRFERPVAVGPSRGLSDFEDRLPSGLWPDRSHYLHEHGHGVTAPAARRADHGQATEALFAG